MKSSKNTSPTFIATVAIVAVVLILIFSNWLVQSTSIGNRSLDFTEDKRHTLTDGTLAILDELDTPIIIRYYATRKSELMPRRLKNYMRKVDSLLSRYSQLSERKIKIINLDPQPDTDAEDSANLDGIFGQKINEENLYFGLSISCLDQKTTIPLLDPNDERMLEYYLSSSIANVSTFEKPILGLMTTLPLVGNTHLEMQIGQQPQEPWIIYQLLEQRYRLANLGMTPATLDPALIPVLLIIHPAGISVQTQYVIDQYLLKGGIVIACLDPYALTAPQGNAMIGTIEGTKPSSHLTSLLPAWGVGIDSTAVIADGKYATDLGNTSAGGKRLFAHLTLSSEALTSNDEVITRGFESLYFPLTGGFSTNQKIDGIKVESLVETSNDIITIGGSEAAKGVSEAIFAQKASEVEPYSLVLRLSGEFPSAFPDGDPSLTQSENAEKKETDESLKKSLTKSTVYLIADADFLFDKACFRSNKKGFVAVNNNPALLQNMIDQCMGSKHLIGSRGRASSTRPFTLIKQMETEFEQELQVDVDKARAEMESIISQLQELHQQKTSGEALVLSPDQEAKILQLQEKQDRLSRELREKQKGLRSRKDKLYAKITWLTVVPTPTFMAFIGLFVWIRRRSQTRAK